MRKILKNVDPFSPFILCVGETIQYHMSLILFSTWMSSV